MPFQYLTAAYQSKTNWYINCNYLHCNPLFYGRPCFDSVLIDRGEDWDPYFGHLVIMSMCNAFNATYPVTIIEAYEACKLESRSMIDKELGFLWLCYTRKVEFLLVKFIIRGLVLVEDNLKSSCIIFNYCYDHIICKAKLIFRFKFAKGNFIFCSLLHRIIYWKLLW
jgi:hypothetical protein